MFDSLSPMLIAAAVIGGYLLGSIPFGLIAAKLTKKARAELGL